MTFTRAVALWWLVLTLGSADAAVTVKVVDLPTRGVTIRVGYVKPDAPIATLIGYSGGDGRAFIDDNFAGSPHSFALADLGIAVAYVDLPSDLPGGLTRDFRESPEHAADALEVIKFVRQQADVPVWLGGISNGTVSVTYFGINLPSDLPFGLVLASSRTVDGNLAYSVFHMDLESIRRPTLVLAHAEDPCNVTPPGNAPLLFARLTSAPGKDLVFLTGGVAGPDPCNGGHHLFEGQTDESVAVISAFIKKYNALLVAPNFQGIWWNAPAASESGWGINLAHQGDTIFAAWYTYDANGRALWFTMLAEKTGPNTYAGKLYENRGPALNAQPFNKDLVQQAEVGDGTLTFTDGDNGTFRYTVNGITQTKPLVRFVFGPVPTCTWGALADLSLATNYQDMWWNAPAESESGWGVTLTHQGDVIFVAWFTYDLDGKPLWLTAIVRKGAPGVYSGEINRTTGPAFSAMPWDKNTVTDTTVGDLTITFANGNHASFHYTLSLGTPPVPIDQTKTIERFVFRASGTACH